ncbi:PLP-dependent aminotransferase family protein, partial [Phytoactinopolyspora endophytica]|uniref:aminotransferase-like domain-containing protein n=1 Tax=Phytoactinopolyspora endophytica TaxID=1642495 RepID=UPI00197C27D6
VLRTNGTAALQYGTTEGHVPLREWVAARYQGVQVDGVQIVSGSQQGLDLVAKCYLDPGDSVVVTAPTYTGALRAFDPYEVRYRPVETDDDGMVPESLEAALVAGAKLIYAIPNFDNPTGTLLSLPRRHAVVELARRYGVPILEDNPYGDLRFEGEALPHLYELAPELVIHAGTFSKTIVPGFRLAWLVASPEALEPIRRAKQAADLHTSTFVQVIAMEVAQDGF